MSLVTDLPFDGTDLVLKDLLQGTNTTSLPSPPPLVVPTPSSALNNNIQNMPSFLDFSDAAASTAMLFGQDDTFCGGSMVSPIMDHTPILRCMTAPPGLTSMGHHNLSPLALSSSRHNPLPSPAQSIVSSPTCTSWMGLGAEDLTALALESTVEQMLEGGRLPEIADMNINVNFNINNSTDISGYSTDLVASEFADMDSLFSNDPNVYSNQGFPIQDFGAQLKQEESNTILATVSNLPTKPSQINTAPVSSTNATKSSVPMRTASPAPQSAPLKRTDKNKAKSTLEHQQQQQQRLLMLRQKLLQQQKPAPVIPTDLPSLLNSETLSLCRKVLEEPLRRKPGRKPKGSQPANFSSLSARLLERDPDAPPLDKKEERKLKNREAADQSRKRLRERATNLESYAGRLKVENQALKKAVEEMEKELGLSENKDGQAVGEKRPLETDTDSFSAAKRVCADDLEGW
ncbi:hypothetical protein HK102_010166 [Quaeritorhiza haematococci]|nr:hypothetical protein HK102_010166 [Quaeritorhiza haematococci]